MTAAGKSMEAIKDRSKIMVLLGLGSLFPFLGIIFGFAAVWIGTVIALDYCYSWLCGATPMNEKTGRAIPTWKEFSGGLLGAFALSAQLAVVTIWLS